MSLVKTKEKKRCLLRYDIYSDQFDVLAEGIKPGERLKKSCPHNPLKSDIPVPPTSSTWICSVMMMIIERISPKHHIRAEAADGFKNAPTARQGP